MRQTPALVIAIAVALAATAGGVALAVRSGGYAPKATATGHVTIASGSGVAPGTYLAQYCGSYGNVATQQGYAYSVLLPGGHTLALSDTGTRTPGPQDAARVRLVLDGPEGHYTWPAATGSAAGSVVLTGADLLVADLDVHLIGAGGDTLPVRAHFACRPRVAPKSRPR